MNIKSSTKGRSEPQLKTKIKLPSTEEIVEMKDPVIEGHIGQLKKIVELLDEIKNKADDANNAVVGLVKVITAFHL